MKKITLGILALLLFSITNAQTANNDMDYTPVENSKLLQIDPPLIQLEEVLISVEAPRRTRCLTICHFSTSCGIEIMETASTQPLRVKNNQAKAVLYPNTSRSGIFNLRLLVTSTRFEVAVYNMQGQLLYSKKHLKNDYDLQLDLSNHSSGMYLIRVSENGNLLETIRAIKS